MYFRKKKYIIRKENVEHDVENKDRALIWGVGYLDHFMMCPIYFFNKNL
jgi:hypothetical protein